MSKMNSNSLYVTTNQIVLKSRADNPESWQDLYRLVPYLRNSLCCVVCCNLLISPLTPTLGKCQHHLCNKCRSGKKKIKPTCVWCKECEQYSENKPLRTLLQCYKKMCLYLARSGIYNGLLEQARMPDDCQMHPGAANALLVFINEGSNFHDDYQSHIGLSKAVYSILPCIYTTHNSSTQTQQANSLQHQNNQILQQKTVNGAPLYSVMYAGSGNKITIKRKPKDTLAIDRNLAKSGQVSAIDIQASSAVSTDKAVFKKPPSKCILKQRRGCRCGNATATPGKLTCCGQRCPCYVESKACIECKCRGCRNPHTPDGSKVLNIPAQSTQIIPIATQYQNIQQIENTQLIQNTQQQIQNMQQPLQSTQQIQNTRAVLPQRKSDITVLQHVKIELDANLTIEQLNQHLDLKAFGAVRSHYTTTSTTTTTTTLNDRTTQQQLPHMPHNLLFNMDTNLQEERAGAVHMDVCDA